MAVIVLLFSGGPACTFESDEPPPEQTLQRDPFKPFSLKTPDGEVRELDDFLDQATLVTFFFPT